MMSQLRNRRDRFTLSGRSFQPGVHHEAFDRRSPRCGRTRACRSVIDQPGCCGTVTNKGKQFSHASCDRFQRATLLPAPLSSLRLSAVLSSLLPALLLRATILLSAVSVLRAGPVPVRSRLRSVLVEANRRVDTLRFAPCELPDLIPRSRNAASRRMNGTVGPPGSRRRCAPPHHEGLRVTTHSLLGLAHSWRVHVRVSTVMTGATAHKRGEAQAIVAG